MLTILKNGARVRVRYLQTGDTAKLFNYLNGLSHESKSRFGPHPFDKDTIERICAGLADDSTLRYIAMDEEEKTMIAYMLISQGMIDADKDRYANRDIHFDPVFTATYAPSVADAWQNSGLGSTLFEIIINDLKTKGIKKVVLWGGVQETNTRAVHFYTKYGFKLIAPFWFDNKNNLDMTLDL